MDLRRLPALNALRTFEAAARHESFSRAAEELFVTHGAVSHQLRALEEELGVALFTRIGKRVRLTEAGCRYAKAVRAALMALADATHDVQGSERERHLVVSSSPSFSARWMTPRIGRFIDRNPHINLDLLSTSALADFSRDDVDVAIRYGSGHYPDLHVEPLLEEVIFPVCAPTFNGGQLPKTPADLTHAPLLRSDSELWGTWFAAAGLPGITEPRRGVLFDDSSNLLLAAEDGQGIALARRSIAIEQLIAGRLVRLFDIDAPSQWDYYFVCPPPLVTSSRVQAFRTWLFDEVKQYRSLFEEARLGARNVDAGGALARADSD
ncbi:MAG TPA: transcriptional regulator GcvA [Trinickia sp.]|jgi:LysR family glycine cleavage system transcriptional activator|uniref:transcriptional regulator GcvA n=1 Tax=Trinickia sp. TaxID=2571163 RepID=UPI002B8D7011|nr:transcriptional regulator GcvA [Trinickia sp.]HTI17063.1 transcriptional regulator GcvA [Trinickia sp.]